MNPSNTSVLDILDEALTSFNEIEQDLNEFDQEVEETEACESCPPTASELISMMFDDNESPDNSSSAAVKKNGGKKKAEGKPKRALSAYNIFFQYQRERLIAGNNNKISFSTDDDIEHEIEKIIHNKNNQEKSNKKRKHRKTHGKISFTDLARTIAERWKVLDKDTKAIFENRAQQEKLQYNKELEQWKTQKKNEDKKLSEAGASSEQPQQSLWSMIGQSSQSYFEEQQQNLNKDFYYETPYQQYYPTPAQQYCPPPSRTMDRPRYQESNHFDSYHPVTSAFDEPSSADLMSMPLLWDPTEEFLS